MLLKRPIIVEGPDGAGKTTLLRQLSVDLGFPVHHTGGPALDASHLQQKIWNLHSRKESHLIDRCPHISEPIYAEAEGRKAHLPLSHLTNDLHSLKPLLIYCRLSSVKQMFQSMDKSKKAHKPAEHLAIVAKRYSEIVEAYDSKMAGLSLAKPIKFLKYNWEETPYQSILAEVRKCVG